MSLPAECSSKVLTDLPDELLLRVGDVLPQTQLDDLNTLARSNKRLYNVLNHLLYQRDARFPTPSVPPCISGCPPQPLCAHRQVKYRKCYALFWAATNAGRPTVIRTAEHSLDAGADINAVLEDRFSRKRSSLLQAVNERCLLSYGQPASADLPRFDTFIRFLLARGADINYTDGQTDGAVERAAMTACVDAMRLLLENGADPNALTQEVRGSLPHRLIPRIRNYVSIPHLGDQDRRRDFVEILQLLLQHSADPNARNRFGKTPLHDLVEHMHGLPDSDIDIVEKAVEFLLEHGADPNAASGPRMGYVRPLHSVLLGTKFRPSLIKLCLRHGGDTSEIHLPKDSALRDAILGICDEVSRSTGQNFEFLPPR